MQTNLGLNEQVSAWRIKTSLSLQGALDLRRDIISFVGMTKDGPPDVRRYPTAAGNGGAGVQVYQPITESFCIVGTWPEHGFIRVYLASCRPFSHGAVTVFLGKVFGIENILMQWQMPI